MFPDRPQYTVNYDFADRLRQTGYMVYYPAKANNGNFIVVPDDTFCSEVMTTKTTGDNSPLQATIDLEFNVPLNLKGRIFFNVPIGQELSTTTNTFYCTLAAYHYDGSTETQIGSTATSESYTSDTDSVNDGPDVMITALYVDTGSTIHFKAGEIFRVKLNVYTTGNVAISIGFAHDPANRAEIQPVHGANDEQFAVNETRQAWYLPVKLDI